MVTYSSAKKKALDATLAKYPPNKFVTWVYKWFSTNLKKKPSPIGSFICILSFVIATVGMITFDSLGNHIVASLFSCLYFIFFCWVPITLPAFIMNKKRVTKIIKELEISVEEYNKLIDFYYSQLYN